MPPISAGCCSATPRHCPTGDALAGDLLYSARLLGLYELLVRRVGAPKNPSRFESPHRISALERDGNRRCSAPSICLSAVLTNATTRLKSGTSRLHPPADRCRSRQPRDRHQVKNAARNALSIYEVFDDVLARLQPTHILTQVQCEVCAVSLRDVERSIASRLARQSRVVALNPGFAGRYLGRFPARRGKRLAMEIAGRPVIGRTIKARMTPCQRRRTRRAPG